MIMGLKKSSMALLAIVIAMSAVLLAGCGTKSNSSEGEQIFRINMHSEPPTLDPAHMQDNISSTVANAIFEGLTVLDKDGLVKEGVAEKWDISEDGLVYTFYLRADAKWSNGDPVTAHDFEFAWKRVLDPNTAPAPVYAYQLYYIKNAAKYNAPLDSADRLDDWSQVGVKALDEKTLEVTLENKTPYFLSLTSFYTYLPVHQATVEENEAFAAEADTLITNGPFVIGEWVHNDKITLVPNEHYWNRDIVNFDEVRMTMINDAATELSMYKTDELDFVGKPTGEIETDQIPVLKKQYPDEFHNKGIASIYYYVFNTTAEPFDNVNIRKAFALAIDRQQIVQHVSLGGELPAYGFVPPGMKGTKAEFREEYKDTDYFQENLDEAKRLLQQGMTEKGYSTLPPITLIFNENAGHKKMAEAIADMWKNNLGVDVKVEQQEWGVFLTNRSNLNYQVARSGWLPDYNDPMSFIDMWTSTSGNNDSGWKNSEYDALVQQAYSSDAQQDRMDAMAKAESLLVKDHMVVMPIYYYTSANLMKPYVKNVYLDYKGDIFFNEGYLEK